jgi:hypothetical protein
MVVESWQCTTFGAGVPARDRVVGISADTDDDTVVHLDEDPACCGTDPTERSVFHSPPRRRSPADAL